MKLTTEQFMRIRPLSWTINSNSDIIYHTTDTPYLFWYDFMRKIFGPDYYSKQRTITRIVNFDMQQPVLIDNELNLLLPVDIETAIYAANNQTLPKPFFSIGLNKFMVLFVIIVLYAIIVLVDFLQLKLIQSYRSIL